MSLKVIDSHCHLNSPRYREEGGKSPADLVAAATANGVELMQTICTQLDEFEEVFGIAQAHDNVYCSFGIHPHEAGDYKTSVAEIVEKTSHPKVIGIGETGLDYYYNNAPKREQWQNFSTHLEASRETGLPVIIHTRDAEDDTKAILKEVLGDGPLNLLFHCFTGSDDLADFGLEHDIWLSASGIITFNKAKELQATFARMPLERLLIETDAPYLAPVPNRGKLNEPAWVVHVAEQLAKLQGESVETVANKTRENFFKLFRKAQPTS